MGLLGKLLGKKDRDTVADGMWLRGERDGSWVKIANFENGQSIEYNEHSCYTDKGESWVVLRSVYEEKRMINYIGAWIFPEADDYIVVVCDRFESTNGRVVRPDNWKRKRFLYETNVKGIKSLIFHTRNLAKAHNYLNPPAYVIMLQLGLAQSSS
jgi:hypothetical protein